MHLLGYLHVEGIIPGSDIGTVHAYALYVLNKQPGYIYYGGHDLAGDHNSIQNLDFAVANV